MTTATEESRVLEAERQRCAALVAGDAAVLRKLFTDDFVYVHSSGRSEAKASYVPTATNGENKFLTIRHEDLKAEVMGDVALMTGTVEMNRAKGTVVFLFSEVWVRDDGAWRLKYQQNTKKAA